MRRVFFVDADIEPSVRAELEHQLDLGVEVYTVPYESVADNPDLNILMIADTEARIGWNYELAEGRRILKIHATTNEVQVKRYVRRFDELMRLKACVEFVRHHD